MARTTAALQERISKNKGKTPLGRPGIEGAKRVQAARRRVFDLLCLAKPSTHIHEIIFDEFQMNPSSTDIYIAEGRHLLRAQFEQESEEHAAVQSMRLVSSIARAKEIEDFGGQASLERVLSSVLGTARPQEINVRSVQVSVDAKASELLDAFKNLGSATSGAKALAHEVALAPSTSSGSTVELSAIADEPDYSDDF